MKISVIGLGKLGACAAACFAYRGFQTVGMDLNPAVVDAINEGRAPVQEPRLQELIAASRDRLRATKDYAEAIRESDASFLIVPTPSCKDGHFSEELLRQALEPLARAFRDEGKPYHLFVITSTVSPGTTEEILIPLLESVSGRSVNRDFGVCYNPEFIALGNVINGSLNPDMVLIGESDSRAGDIVEEIHSKICENKPYVGRMSIISAEIAKISLNSYVTMKISFANTLASLCERIPRADVDAITKALGADKRISPHYLKGGLGFGGPCFPRDNRAFAAFAEKYEGQSILARATDTVNHVHAGELARRVLQFAKKGDMVGVLGLAYKPDTPVIEESPALSLIRELVKKEVRVIAYDPLAMEGARSVLGDSISYASSAKDCLSKSSVCIVATPWDGFKTLNEDWIVHNTTTVIDCWRILDPSSFSGKVRYVPMGRYY